jgi:hypothetical protein
MYTTKPFIYQIILKMNKDRLANEIKRHAPYNTFVFTVTLESVQEKFSQKFAPSKKKSTPGKIQPVLLLTTPRKSFLKKFKKVCCLRGKPGHK